MTEKDDLRARLYELHVGTDEHHATARQIRVMIHDGDLAGAADALDALDADIHPALAAGGSPEAPTHTHWVTRNVTSAELLGLTMFNGQAWILQIAASNPGDTFTLTVDGDTTDPIAWDIDSAGLEAVLQGFVATVTVSDTITDGERFIAFAESGHTLVADLSGVSVSSVLNEAPYVQTIEILPAPGGRKYYVPIYAVFHYRPGSTPYVGTIYPYIGWADAGVIPAVNGFAAAPPTITLDRSTDGYVFVVASLVTGFIDLTIVENTPLVFWNGYTFAPLTEGDGTLSIRVLYSIIDGAPA
jgi:hypothetical protein